MKQLTKGVLMRQPVDELIQCYQDNLYAVAFNVCKNQMDAEDIVQEAFVKCMLQFVENFV